MDTLMIIACGGAAVFAAPYVLSAVGFTTSGIAAGSYAASMMSAADVANGGGVAAGSLVSILQAFGAACCDLSGW
ncbi:interferon alpha-inducible protein 27, mitochondrial-like [Garra rufa]|uniref:interferon alpha-inducible protein 27, mitochondrial-like n=1 Tax=Garra rufa TaxID=137080 RepID=UPI003CCEC80A